MIRLLTYLSIIWWTIIIHVCRYGIWLISSHLNGADPIEFFCSVDGMSFEKFRCTFETRKELPLWPLLFLTISCGAHATQSPLMARCG